MIATDELNYGAVLRELGAVLEEKNMTISCQKLQIEQLKEKLAKTEYERDEAIAELKALHKGGASK